MCGSGGSGDLFPAQDLSNLSVNLRSPAQMAGLVMEVCVDSLDSAIAFVGALPSPEHTQAVHRLTAFMI